MTSKWTKNTSTLFEYNTSFLSYFLPLWNIVTSTHPLQLVSLTGELLSSKFRSIHLSVFYSFLGHPTTSANQWLTHPFTSTSSFMISYDHPFGLEGLFCSGYSIPKAFHTICVRRWESSWCLPALSNQQWVFFLFVVLSVIVAILPSPSSHHQAGHPP